MRARERSTLARRAAAALEPLSKWHHQCHAASLALVRAGIGTRVARGTCVGVGGQHSWVGDMLDERHRPHGYGSIWDYGRPARSGGPVIALTPKAPLGLAAREFLAMVGPLDARGWMALAHAPVNGWPAGEIFAAMDDTDALCVLVPIDILGMTTDRNPGGVYR